MISVMDKSKAVSLKTVLKAVVTLGERMATKEDLRNYATRNDLEKFKEDILEEMRPIAKAVDKDAEALIRHEKRILRVEQRLAIK